MKKLALVIFAVLIVTAAFAFDKGTLNPGGTLSFSSSKSDSDAETYTVFSLAPQVGYFVKDNLSIDVLFDIRAENQGDQSLSLFGIGVGARYFYKMLYFGPGFIHYSQNYDYGIIDGTTTANYLALKAGFLVPVVENVYVDLGMNYKFGIGEYGGDGSGNNEGSTLTVGAGLQVLFPKTK